MFSAEHFIWMALCAVFVALLTFLSLRFKFSYRTSALIMALVAFVSELSKILSHMEFVNGEDVSDGMVIEAGALPLHLCSLLVFVFLFLPFCQNQKLKAFLNSFIVPIGLIGSLTAILVATSGTDFTKITSYQCFVYHAAMIWFALYLVLTGQADLGIRAWIRNMATLFSLAVLMIWVNGALQAYDTNFFYVVRPPADNLPLLNLDKGWFAYIGGLMLCGLVGVTAVHLPGIIGELKRKGKK